MNWKHTLKGVAWFLAGIALVWLLTVAGFFEVNTIAFAVTVVLFLPSLHTFRKGELSTPRLKYFLLSLICVASAVIISFQ